MKSGRGKQPENMSLILNSLGSMLMKAIVFILSAAYSRVEERKEEVSQRMKFVVFMSQQTRSKRSM